MTPTADRRRPLGLAMLIAAQSICAAFFVGDVVNDLRNVGQATPLLSVESATALVLVASVLAEVLMIRRILQREARYRRNASMAARAMHDVVEAHFDNWNLTPSERDIAGLIVKGLSIAEIAGIRGSAEGTVKSHMNAIYRKSDSQNRGELLAQIIDSVMEQDAKAA